MIYNCLKHCLLQARVGEKSPSKKEARQLAGGEKS